MGDSDRVPHPHFQLTELMVLLKQNDQPEETSGWKSCLENEFLNIVGIQTQRLQSHWLCLRVRCQQLHVQLLVS